MKNVRTRREFITGILRGGLIGGLIAGGVALVRRNGIDRSAHACSGGGICSGCGRVDSCVLPQAASRRQAVEKPDTGVGPGRGAV